MFLPVRLGVAARVMTVRPGVGFSDPVTSDRRCDDILFVDEMKMKLLARGEKIAQRQKVEIIVKVQEVFDRHRALPVFVR